MRRNADASPKTRGNHPRCLSREHHQSQPSGNWPFYLSELHLRVESTLMIASYLSSSDISNADLRVPRSWLGYLNSLMVLNGNAKCDSLLDERNALSTEWQL